MFFDNFRSVLNSKLFCYMCNSRLKRGKAFIEFPSYISGHKYIEYKKMSSKPGLRIECINQYMGENFNPLLIIGENVSFNFRCHIGVINKIIIGDNVLVGSNVLITDHSHGTGGREEIEIAPVYRKLYSKGPVIIEHDVWIGEGACILPNVKIGHNSIIGANTVVTHDVPPYCVFAGNSGTVIKEINH